jgi:hypothetical protein
MYKLSYKKELILADIKKLPKEARRIIKLLI